MNSPALSVNFMFVIDVSPLHLTEGLLMPLLTTYLLATKSILEIEDLQED